MEWHSALPWIGSREKIIRIHISTNKPIPVMSQKARQDADDPFWSLRIRSNFVIENERGKNNTVRTTKYTLFSFPFLSVFMQFKRIANVYFLVVSILMLIGMYAPHLYETPLDPFSTVIPLCVVLSITCIKEALEDIQRANFDREENNREVTIIDFENGKVKEKVVRTKDISAGTIVKLSGKMQVPCDLLLVFTSNFDDGNQCYIETANIDGETNLKVREAPQQIKQILKDDGSSHLEQLFVGHVEVQPPSADIHNFVGSLNLDSFGSNPAPLDAKNLLLRSSVFCNTEWAYGIAIYTGQETKVQMNNRVVDTKMSTIEKLANTGISLIFITKLIVVFLAVGSVYIMGWDDREFFSYIYPDGNGNSILPIWLESFFIFFILFNNMIPISLYVTLEMVNVGQAMLISSDKNLYDADLNTPCLVKSSNMCQELGMVSNIFSDKTGTLTRNEMVLVKIIVDGKVIEVENKNNINSNGKTTIGTLPGAGAALGSGKGINLETPDNVFVKAIRGPNGRKSKEFDFLRCLSTCHTVVREKNGTYRAESPDELALVEGVGYFKCFLKERGAANLELDLVGVKTDYQVLAVNEFDPTRKRMSILVKDISTGQHYVMCKGADSAMIDVCTRPGAERVKLEKNLMDLAVQGLRTLVIAHQKLSSSDVKTWLQKYTAAKVSLKNREERLSEVAELLECNLELLGVTAIEDRLQDEVPEVIADLAKAGVVLWMLTGDKEETAIEIGTSCNLLTSNVKPFFLTKIDKKEAYYAKLQEIYAKVVNNIDENGLYTDFENPIGVQIALVIDGPSFKLFDSTDIKQREMFLTIGQACRSVIACRLTPAQKQLVVSIVKNDTVPKKITLAIGDGANDVSMIREADVGIGIIGKEGKQAANNADIAIGQFKFLRRLLLVHGRWNYIRASNAFLYCMHKNLVISFTLLWFSYIALLSGTSPYESYIYTGYNFALGLPIVFFGIMDRDITEDFALKYPQTYSTGRENTMLHIWGICKWIINAIVFAIVICLMAYIILEQTFWYHDLYSCGTITYVGLIHALQLKVSFIHHQWNQWNVLAMLVSLGGTFFVIYALNTALAFTPEYYGIWDNLITNDKILFFVIGGIITPFFCLGVDFVSYAMTYIFAPTKEMQYRTKMLEEQNLANAPKKSDSSLSAISNKQSSEIQLTNIM